jgi:hypothetical protein
MALNERSVEIRRPCPVKLDPSRAAGGVRSWHCGHCDKAVHVLSNMTESEARAFLGERVGQDLCVTYAVRRDGSIRFEPEPTPAADTTVVPIGALTRRRKLAAAVGLGVALAACAPHDNPSVDVRVRVEERPAQSQRATPTIPDAPPSPDAPVEPDEVLVDGEIEPLPMKPGGLRVEPLPPPPPPAGGLTVAPLPPPDTTDEPRDPAEPAEPVLRRGGLRPSPRSG